MDFIEIYFNLIFSVFLAQIKEFSCFIITWTSYFLNFPYRIDWTPPFYFIYLFIYSMGLQAKLILSNYTTYKSIGPLGLKHPGQNSSTQHTK